MYTQLPTIFAIEVVLGCNLRCVECAVGGNLVKRKYGYMKYEQFKIIADKIKQYCTYMYLHLWGEPMINPEIIPMIQLASTFSKTNISTNAVTIDDRLAKKLICSGVTEIIVSIDGISQETYATYRRRGDVKRALLGLSYLVRHNLLSKRNVTIIPQFIVFEHNKHEMAAFAKFCHSLDLIPSFKAPYLRPGAFLKNSGIPQYERQIMKDKEQRKLSMKQCNLDNVCTITLDGSVIGCCYDHNAENTFGNIFLQDLTEIWNTRNFICFRESVKKGKAPLFCTNNCLLF